MPTPIASKYSKETARLADMIKSCFTYGGADPDSYNYSRYILPYKQLLPDNIFDLVYAVTLQDLKTNWMILPSSGEDGEGNLYNTLIPVSLIQDLFVTAWEQSCNYWAAVTEPGNAEATFEKMRAGYTLRVSDCEDPDQVWNVTVADLKNGLIRLRRYPEHLKNVMSGNWDAETADVWFQLAVIKELRYG